MSELEDIAQAIEKLSEPDKLRLAAELLEHKKDELAYRVIDAVRLELGAAIVLRNGGPFTWREGEPKYDSIDIPKKRKP